MTTSEVRIPSDLEHTCWRAKPGCQVYDAYLLEMRPKSANPGSGERSCAPCGYVRGWQDRQAQQSEASTGGRMETQEWFAGEPPTRATILHTEKPFGEAEEVPVANVLTGLRNPPRKRPRSRRAVDTATGPG